MSEALPVIDVTALMGPATARADAGDPGDPGGRGRTAAERVALEIGDACRESGFFYVTGHGVPDRLLRELDSAARRFFALPLDRKMEISMEKGGRAWRGFFPVGAELTSGRPDLKEGLYFGTESAADDPRPLHGRNLFPSEVPELGLAVTAYLGALTEVAQGVMRGIALSLGLRRDYFSTGYTADPTILFRIFHYPPAPPDADGWGVGEHTDYGLLTLLLQDGNGGLQVHGRNGWVDAPPVPGTFVCNIGDMLDKLTGSHYRSTPHRVRNLSGRSRLSFPFFFDPGWDAEVPPLPALPYSQGGRPRWDGQDLRAFTGTYGDYLTAKVAKVFPRLGSEVIGGSDRT
ncbi:2-oxoglutarate and iron-dependent oxygenase domain-containing protein [Sphaerisporangium sp. NPDC049002]|uniref:isopenicillin N synthase family dioxygenase n=1 Tax=unclassified Sphaerisporangium TaxID=2630420 RepID=UPI0033C4014F